MKHFVLLALLVSCAAPPPPSPPELASWLEAWEQTRICLVANRGGAKDLAVALKIAQLRGVRCAPPPMGLVAGVEPALAAQWQRVLDRVGLIAKAEAIAGLAAELDAIDADVIELRKRAGLKLIERTPLTPLVTLEPGRPLALPGGAVTFDEITSFEPVVARRNWHEHAYELMLDGETALVARGDFRGVIARPSAAWTVWRTGEPEHRYNISDRPDAGAELPSHLKPRFALDGHGIRAVVMSNDGFPFLLAVSQDHGASWEMVPGPESMRYAGGSQDPRTGEVHVFLRDVDALWMLVFAQDSLPDIARAKRLPVGQFVDHANRPLQSEAFLAGSRRVDCRSANMLWVAARDMLLQVGDDTIGFTIQRRRVEDPIASVSCKDDLAITLRHDPDIVDRCIAGGCGPVLELAKGVRGAATMLADGRWMYAAAVDDILGIWRADTRPRFYRLANRGEIVGIPQLAGAPYLAVSTGDGIRLVRLP